MTTLAVAAFTWVSITQVRDEQAITREGQITDRYNAAVENLGSDSADVRLGGVYALQRIMQDSARDQPTIINVLSAYVRTHTAKVRSSKHMPARDLSTDVTAALRAACFRNTAGQRDGVALLDFHGADLSGADLAARSFDWHDDPTHANLNGAHLNNTTWRGANLLFASLVAADLRHADLRDAKLHGSKLQADFTGADLRGADLQEADLAGVILRADFHNADLRGADLRGARLGPFFDLGSDSLAYSVDLTNADLRGANFTGTDITVDQVLTAFFDETTKLPSSVADDPRVQARIVAGHHE